MMRLSVHGPRADEADGAARTGPAGAVQAVRLGPGRNRAARRPRPNGGTDPLRESAESHREPAPRWNSAPIVGSSFVDLLCMFQDDPATEGMLLIGEIGGTAEEEAAAWIAQHATKPIAAFIAGRTAARQAHGSRRRDHCRRPRHGRREDRRVGLRRRVPRPQSRRDGPGHEARAGCVLRRGVPICRVTSKSCSGSPFLCPADCRSAPLLI